MAKPRKISAAQAAKINAKRSPQARAADKARKSKKIDTTTNWAAHPGRSDYPGIDTPRKKKRGGKKASKKRTSKKRTSKPRKLTVAEASKINARRSPRAKAADKARTSKRIDTTTRWAEHPGRSDYPGVDTPRKSKSFMERLFD